MKYFMEAEFRGTLLGERKAVSGSTDAEAIADFDAKMATCPYPTTDPDLRVTLFREPLIPIRTYGSGPTGLVIPDEIVH